VDRVSWQHQYKRLLTAYGKKANADQSAEFFAAVQSSGAAAVHDGISAAIREGKYFPTVAELLAAVRNASHRHAQPVVKCEACDGSTWAQHTCDGVTASKDGPLVTNRAHFCGVGDTPHQTHAYARRCGQCWTFPNTTNT
jgi:hypothetical protein